MLKADRIIIYRNASKADREKLKRNTTNYLLHTVGVRQYLFVNIRDYGNKIHFYLQPH